MEQHYEFQHQGTPQFTWEFVEKTLLELHNIIEERASYNLVLNGPRVCRIRCNNVEREAQIYSISLRNPLDRAHDQ
jgi:hypothetical protein